VTAARADDSPRAEGLVVACRRRHFQVRLDDGSEVDCVLRGRALAPACGDRVVVTHVAGGGAIDSITPRRSLVYRSDAFKEKLVAANVTLICGVVAPGISSDLELVHRWTVAAEAEGCAFVLAANKADLPEFPELLARLAPFAELGYPIVTLAAKRDAAPLLPWLAGAHTVLVGQSGMGKSTILNALAPDAGAKTGEVSVALATGRHTTSHSTLHCLPAERGGGWIVDSPGMKAFGLAHVAPDELPRAFVEIRPFLGHCRFRDCRHASEPDCAVRAAVDTGHIAAHRLALLHTLVAASAAVRAPGAKAPSTRA
jgi:ribosome biogenesis GTPase